MKGAKEGFKKLYFMFSSQSDQSSYTTDIVSYFTKSIVEAIAAYEGPSIRYKEVIDFVSDFFTANSEQTPYFVAQADFTEVFCDINAAIKAEAQTFLKATVSSASPGKDGAPAHSMVAKIVEDAKNYCTQEQADEALNTLMAELSNIEVPKLLEQLYDFELSPSNSQVVPDAAAIGAWIAKQADDKSLFAKAFTEIKTVKVKKRDPFKFTIMESLGEFKTVEEGREVITGFRSTVEMPYYYLSLTAKQKYPNLERIEWVVVLLFRAQISVYSGQIGSMNLLAGMISALSASWSMRP